jgi:hypothetical protein
LFSLPAGGKLTLPLPFIGADGDNDLSLMLMPAIVCDTTS